LDKHLSYEIRDGAGPLGSIRPRRECLELGFGRHLPRAALWLDLSAFRSQASNAQTPKVVKGER